MARTMQEPNKWKGDHQTRSRAMPRVHSRCYRHEVSDEVANVRWEKIEIACRFGDADSLGIPLAPTPRIRERLLTKPSFHR